MYTIPEKSILISFLMKEIDKHRQRLFKEVKTLKNDQFDAIVKDINHDIKLINIIENGSTR